MSLRTYAAAAILLAISACSAQPAPQTAPTPTPTPSASVTPAMEPPKPTRGSCYRLSLAAALAPTSATKPARCRGKWTSRTFHVGALSTVTEDGHLLAVDSASVQSEVASHCPQRLLSYLGGDLEDLRLSVFRAIWFTPTLEEANAGANWFRCDVVALAKPGKLTRFTRDLRGVLDRDYSAYALCGTAKPDTEGFQRVACTQEHTWRALRSVELKGAKYPGSEQAQRLGVSPCTEAARAGASDALDFQWGYEWPTKGQWKGKADQPPQRYGICWAPADGS